MNGAAGSQMVEVGELAARQLKDYDSHQPGMLFAEGCVLDVSQGYELQNAVAKLRFQRGERMIGYKVGCTSSAIQEQLKITHRVRGFLFDTEHYESGVALSRQSFDNLAIEGELAIELSREPREEDFTVHSLPACIARVFPVIELHNHVMRGQQASAGELIANNAIHAGIILGPKNSLPNNNQVTDLKLIYDKEIIDSWFDKKWPHDMLSEIEWFVLEQAKRNNILKKGNLILTGAYGPPIPIKNKKLIEVTSSLFGNVSAIFK